MWFPTHTHARTHCRPLSLCPAAASTLPSVAGSGGCLENTSSVDARRLFSCQKILFTFHFYTAPSPHSGAFSSLLHFQKTCTACTCAFPLSISLSDSNQLADLRAGPNKYTLTVVSTSPTQACFREEMAFLSCLAEQAPHETHWWCLIENNSLTLAALRMAYFYFTYSTYCSCPCIVHTVACIMRTIGTYYFVMKLRLELWPSCLYPWLTRPPVLPYNTSPFTELTWDGRGALPLLL